MTTTKPTFFDQLEALGFKMEDFAEQLKREVDALDDGMFDGDLIEREWRVRELDDVTLANCMLPWFDDPLTLHVFRNKLDTVTSNPCTATYREMLQKYFAVHRAAAEKDGRGTIGAKFIRYTGQIDPKTGKPHSSGRKDEFVESVTFIQFDFDNKKPDGRPTTFDDIVVWLKRHRYAGYIYTTYSHSENVTKFRVIVFLKSPFHIRDSLDDPNGAAREELYRRGYAHLAEDIGEPWDKTCANPSRLYYTPAYNINEEGAEALCHVQFVPGDQIDFDAVVAKLPAEQSRAKKTKRPKLETRDREEFNEVWKFVRTSFNGASFAFDYDGTAKDRGEKVETFCPFNDEHGHPDEPDKTPVFWLNADVAKHGTATAVCQHESCKIEHKRTAGDFVFAVLGDKSIETLSEYIDDVAVAERFVDWLAARPVTLEQCDNAIAAVIADNARGLDNAKVVAALNLLARYRDEVRLPGLIERLADEIDVGVSKIERIVKAQAKKINQTAQRAQDGARCTERLSHHTVPTNPADAAVIYSSWDYTEQLTCAVARFKRQNDIEPKIFLRIDGSVVRVQKIDDKSILSEVETTPHWTHEIRTRMGFRVVSADDPEGHEDAPFPTVVSEFMGALNLGLPVVERVVRVPVFSKDGTLRQTEGYDRPSRTYLDPNIECIPLPDVITPDEVDAAVDLIYEAIRDFPFSDNFTGSDPLPVRDGTVDADGHPQPNLARGRSSRAHAIAMILQAFVRAMIDGPCPGYFIDKSMPGTGAGYLADVGAIILTGERQTVQTIANSDEEFRKEITSTLMEGAAIIFNDNINHKVDSGALAAALTAGVWKARILQHSKNATAPIKATWMFAGNNVEFSDELMRRLAPSRMDAALPNPDSDRPPSWFKHPDLHAWLIAERRRLLWACHVMVQYWIQEGAPKGAAVLASFTSWSQTMGGILEVCGVPGFLDNVRAFRDGRTSETADGAARYIDRLLEVVAVGENFDVAIATTAAQSRISGQLDPVFNIACKRPDDDHEVASAMGRWLRKMIGVPFKTKAGVVQVARATDADGKPAKSASRGALYVVVSV